MRARREIREGEELTVTYVDPNMPVNRRRMELMPWVFGTCECSRCITEEKEDKVKETGEPNGKVAASEEGTKDLEGLEEELKHGLGIV